jgi:PAS domain-containing protein
VASLIDYAPLAVAGLWIGHPPTPRRYLATALDATVLSLAAALLAWITLISPTLTRLRFSAVGRDLVLLDWATDIATLAVAILLILTWRANRSALLLGAAIIAVLGSDVAQSIALLHGSTRATSIDIGFVLFCALAGLAALNPSMTRITSVGTAPERLSVWHFLALAVALLIPPIILLAETANAPGHGNGASIATVAAIIGLVMLLRVAVGVRALRERVSRDFAMHEAASLLGAVHTSDEVGAVLASTARSILPAGNTAVGLYPPDAALSEPVEIRETIGGAGFLRLPVAVVPSDVDGTGRPIAEVRFASPAVRLFPRRPELTTLAAQAGTALARIRLAAVVRRHERESYFRTLVQNSTDVILICRDGTVDYATPAAAKLFAGDTVVGRRIGELITMAGPESASDVDAIDATVDGPDGHPAGTRAPPGPHRRPDHPRRRVHAARHHRAAASPRRPSPPGHPRSAHRSGQPATRARPTANRRSRRRRPREWRRAIYRPRQPQRDQRRSRTRRRRRPAQSRGRPHPRMPTTRRHRGPSRRRRIRRTTPQPAVRERSGNHRRPCRCNVSQHRSPPRRAALRQ